ncbi:MAG: putative Ig domain-containing protein [Burkholderiales bacterium]|nr:putative Ig domain-containing protein [Burkholderiales bacterium]
MNSIPIRLVAYCFWSFMLAFTLAGCGGGGPGGTKTVDLYVTFSYASSQVTLKTPLTVKPVIDGLQGHAPTCTVAGGSLPAGMTIDSSTCVISGTPTAAGNFGVTVVLSSSGVQGSVSTNAWITVVDPTPTLTTAPLLGSTGYNQAKLDLSYGTALPSTQLVALAPTFVPLAGDSITYSVSSGRLPSGITLDASTGNAQGIPTGVGNSQVEIAATLVRNGVSYQTQPVSIAFNVTASNVPVSYPPFCGASVALNFSCGPVFDNPSALQGLTLHYSSVVLPAGLGVDAQTGVISGAIGAVGQFPATIAIHAVYPDGSAQDTTVPLTLFTDSVHPLYAPSASNFGVASGPEMGIYGPPALHVQLTIGQPFGIHLTGIHVSAPGDVYAFALQPYFSMPLPSWLSIDPVTGLLTGTPPAGTVDGYWSVQLTTLRAGASYVSSIPMYAAFGP